MITPDEKPWEDDWFPMWDSVEKAKAACEAEYDRRLLLALGSRSRQPTTHNPLSPSDRMPGTKPGDLDDAGRCWLWSAPADSLGLPAQWRLLRPTQSAYWDRWLPASVKHLPTEVE